MSTKQEEVTVVANTLTVTESDRKMLAAIIAHQQNGKKVGEYILALPRIFVEVIGERITQAEFARVSGISTTETCRLFHVARIVGGTEITSSDTALRLCEFVYRHNNAGVEFDIIEMRFKSKVAQKADAIVQSTPKWVKGDLAVDSRMATNDLETVRERRKAERIAQGKGGTSKRAPKTLAQQLNAVTETLKGLSQSIATQGVVTDDMKEAIDPLIEAFGELVELLSKGD